MTAVRRSSNEQLFTCHAVLMRNPHTSEHDEDGLSIVLRQFSTFMQKGLAFGSHGGGANG